MPKVSVIIPTYNRTDYLSKTLKSINDQTFQDFEIIVVDDGTPGDENEKLCSEFSKVRYFKIPNSGGPARPRNTGLYEATGEYIAFVDDDDIWLPNKLEKQVKILEDNSDYGLVHSPCRVIDGLGNETGKVIGNSKSSKEKHGWVFERMIGNWTLMMPTVTLRKEILKNTGIFNENIPPALEDVEFFSRLAFYTKFYFLEEPLVLYRKYEQGISRNNPNYVLTPYYLSKVVDGAFIQGLITQSTLRILNYNLYSANTRRLEKKLVHLINEPVTSRVKRHLYNRLTIGQKIRLGIQNLYGRLR